MQRKNPTNPTPLPISVWRKIAFYLDKKEHANLAKTSRFFHKVSSETYGSPALSVTDREINWPQMNYTSSLAYLRPNPIKQSPVYAIAVLSPHFMACGGYDGIIRIWKIGMNDIECIQSLPGHQDSINALHKLSENQLISGGSNGELRLWDLEKKTSDLLNIETKKTLFPHNIIGKGLFFAAKAFGLYPKNQAIVAIAQLDEHLIAVGFASSEIEIWDIQQKKLITTLQGKDENYNICSPLVALDYEQTTQALVACHFDYFACWKIDKSGTGPVFLPTRLNTDNEIKHWLTTENYFIGVIYDSTDGRYIMHCVDSKTHEIKTIDCDAEITSLAVIANDVLVTSHTSYLRIWELKNLALKQINTIHYTDILNQLDAKIDTIFRTGVKLHTLSSGEIILTPKPDIPLMNYVQHNRERWDFIILRFPALSLRNNFSNDEKKGLMNKL